MSGLWDLESCNAVQAQAADLLAAHVRLQSSVTQPFDDPAAVVRRPCSGPGLQVWLPSMPLRRQ